MFRANYTGENKSKLKPNDNYTEDMKRNISTENGNCHACIYVGENKDLSKHRLCAENMFAIAEVSGTGRCDKCAVYWKWYNQINPIKKKLVERSGFVFKNR